MLLAIDSSAGTSVAVIDPATGVLSERSVADTRRHAELIGVLLHDAVREADIEVGLIDTVAIGMGPGPFTGLRVGIAAGRAFALALQRPVVALPSHDSIAYRAYLNGHVGDLVVSTDARRRELYWTAYRGTDASGRPVRSSGPSVSSPHQVPRSAPRITATEVSAGALGLLAVRVLAEQRLPAVGSELDGGPLYLRNPDVTLSPGAAPRGPERR